MHAEVSAAATHCPTLLQVSKFAGVACAQAAHARSMSALYVCQNHDDHNSNTTNIVPSHTACEEYAPQHRAAVCILTRPAGSVMAGMGATSRHAWQADHICVGAGVPHKAENAMCCACTARQVHAQHQLHAGHHSVISCMRPEGRPTNNSPLCCRGNSTGSSWTTKQG